MLKGTLTRRGGQGVFQREEGGRRGQEADDNTTEWSIHSFNICLLIFQYIPKTLLALWIHKCIYVSCPEEAFIRTEESHSNSYNKGYLTSLTVVFRFVNFDSSC